MKRCYTASHVHIGGTSVSLTAFPTDTFHVALDKEKCRRGFLSVFIYLFFFNNLQTQTSDLFRLESFRKLPRHTRGQTRETRGLPEYAVVCGQTAGRAREKLRKQLCRLPDNWIATRVKLLFFAFHETGEISYSRSHK